MSNSNLFTRLVFGIILCGVIGSASALTQGQGDQNQGNQTAKRHTLPAQFRDAWVEPYLEQIQIKGEQNPIHQDIQPVIKVWIMADDKQGVKIYFNQVSKKFGLAHYNPGERAFTYAVYQESQNLGDVITSRN